MPNRPNKFPSRQLDQFNIRLPDGLRDKIKEMAEQNNRSMNAEINFILETAVGDGITGQGTNPDLQKLLQRMSEELDKITGSTGDVRKFLMEVVKKTVTY